MADSVKIRIDGDASGFERELKKTEKSARSQAASLAAEYRKSGMSQSEAMKKAWSEIERSSKAKSEAVKGDFDDEADKAKESSKKIRKYYSGSFSSIEGGFEKALKGIEKGAKKTVSGIAKSVAVIGAGFGAATVAALKFSGELEQNLGGSEAVFKEYAGEIQDTADKAFKNMGLSTSDYLATANKMGALFKGAGFEIKEASDMTTKAMQRAADVASIMGIDVSMAMESIAGAAKGNFTMMDNLGVAMNDTTLNAYALEIGLGKTTDQMTNQEKVALAMEMFLDRTAYAAGNYAKENDTLAGSLTTAKAALKNFISGTGSVDEVVESLTNAGEVIIKNLGELVPKLVTGAGDLVKGLMGQLITMISDNAPQMIDAAIDVLNSFIAGISQNSDKIAQAAVVIMQTLIAGIIEIIPQVIQAAKQIILEFAQELANAYPLLTPLSAIIKLLADNIEILTAAVIAGVVAWKTIAIIKTVTTWYKGLGAGLDLATIKQYALNLAQSLSPMGMLITVVATLTAGIIAYSAATDSAASSQEGLTEELKELKEEYETEIKSADDAMTEKLAEIAVVETLRDKLFELAEQINSNTLTEEEAEKKQAEFNSTANELNNIIPGITDNISTETGQIVIQTNAVNDLVTAYVKLATAKAYAEAYKSKMEAAAKKAVEAEEKIETNQKKMKDYGVVTQETKRIANALGTSVSMNLTTYTDEKGNDITKEYTKAQNNITQAKKDKQEYEKDVKKWSKKYVEKIGEIGDETEKETKKTGGTITNAAKSTTDTVKKETKEQEDAVKKAQEEEQKAIERALKAELREIERQHKLGIISDKEYYDKLGGIRDNYFEKGSDDWQKYTEDIEDYYDDVIKELKDKMESFAEKLEDDANETYATITLDADGEVKTWYTLTDMDSQNAQLEEYLSMLRLLKETRGEIPKEALSDLQNMDTEEAVKFLKVMLNASDEEWNKWASGIEERKAISKELSQEMYSDEIAENQELIQRIRDEWGEVPDDFFKIGEDCATQYGDGFKSQIERMSEELMRAAESMFSNVPAASLNYTVPAAGASGSKIYTDNRTTNIYASGTSPRAIIEAQNQNNIYQAHTSTFGG